MDAKTIGLILLAILALYFGYEVMSNQEAIKASKEAKSEAAKTKKPVTKSFTVEPK